MSSCATTDLCDAHPDLQVCAPILGDYGGQNTFHGRIATLKVFEDNALVRSTLEMPGEGRVLVIDGGGSLRCALVGDLLAALGQRSLDGLLGLNGCVRDAATLAGLSIGVKALATNPLRSAKLGAGERDVPVTFAGLAFHPGHYLYADDDGIVVSEGRLEV